MVACWRRGLREPGLQGRRQTVYAWADRSGALRPVFSGRRRAATHKVSIVDFDATRSKTGTALAGRLDELRRGESADTLEPFAKAYLGMFLEIDEQLEPVERVRLLAAAPIADALLQGFVATLYRPDLPTPAEIGRALRDNQLHAVGYVVLAGIDHYCSGAADDVLALPARTLSSALCLHFANTPNRRDRWAARIISERADIAADAFIELWREMLTESTDYLPGLGYMLTADFAVPVLSRVLPMLLRQWTSCNPAVQRRLLEAALCQLEHEDLLNQARTALASNTDMAVKKRVYWLATAFLLAPEEFAARLADYAGRWREKTLPLLDFTVGVLSGSERPLRLPATALGQLVRIIAPTFRRNEHRNGGLDAASAQVLWLFDLLARDHSQEAIEAVRQLRKARVLRMYSDALDEVERRQRSSTA